MVLLAAQLRKRAFGINLSEVKFHRRGFVAGDPVIRQRLEAIGGEFLRGYHLALEADQPDGLEPLLNAGCPELTGFAFEGASMALALLDFFTPWRRDRVQRFLAGPGDAHAYMVRVGVGWTLARLRRAVGAPADLGPLLGWLAVDGYGFHEGYFSTERYVRRRLPSRASGYARRVFDQGLGRSLWFVECGEVDRIQQTIAAFDSARQSDLWSGIGLASAYAGGADEGAFVALRHAAGPYMSHLMQGVAFAAKARQRAGNPSPTTELAAKIICGLSVHAAAEITELALADCHAGGPEPAYEVWRRGIRSRLGRIAEGSVPSWSDGVVRLNSFVAMPQGLSPSR